MSNLSAAQAAIIHPRLTSRLFPAPGVNLQTLLRVPQLLHKYLLFGRSADRGLERANSLGKEMGV